MKIFILLILILILELKLRPRLEETSKHILLFYGRKTRKYKILYTK